MGIEFGKNDFEDDSITLGADRDHAIDYPDPILSRAEQALIKAKQNKQPPTAEDLLYGYPVQKAIYEKMSKRSAEDLHNDAINTVKGIADATPVIGEIKAAYELPNDLSYAFELVEEGYEEGDLKKMGLGGAFATLSAMGIIPGVRIGAKAGKEAIKASIKAPEGLNIKAAKEVATTGELTNAMQQLAKTQDNEITNNQISEILNKGKPNWTSVDLEDSFSDLSIKNIKVVDSLKPSSQYKMPPQFFNQLKKLETETKAKGVSAQQKELAFDLQMLGESQNQIVTNKQIKEMVELKTGFTPTLQTTNEIQATLNDKGISTINSFDEFKKMTGQDIQEASIYSLEPLKKPEPQLIGGTFAKADVDMTPDQKAILDSIRNKQVITRNLSDTYGQGNLAPNVAEGMHNIKIKGKQYNIKNKADQIEIAKMLPKSIRRTVIEEMNRPVPRVFHGSAGISQPYGRGTAYMDMTRADVLEQDGFMPYSDFEEGVEIGLGGGKGASGVHAELGKKMLSTSRDPLVSIKQSFADNIPANVVSAPFPRSKTRPMKPEEYDVSSTQAQYSRDDTPVSLPMLRHQESEIAFSSPEDIKDIRQLSKQEDKIPKTAVVSRKDLKNIGSISLEDRVIKGQMFANNIVGKFKVLNALLPSANLPTKLNPKQAQVAYNEVRDIMKDLQALGQFTEQYGARGTYDSLYKTFRSNNKSRIKFIADALPEGEKKNMLNSLHKTVDAYSYATGQGAKATRNKSDKELLDIIKSDTSLDEAFERTYTGEDLKRMSFLLTDRLNRGGLMARR